MSAPRACSISQSAGRMRAQAVEDRRDHLARMAVRDPVDLPGRPRPVAELGLGVVGQRADDRDAARTVGGGQRSSGLVGDESAGEREDALVAQQDERATGDVEVESGVRRVRDDLGDDRGIRKPRVLEEPELELQQQDARDRARRGRPR